MSKNIAYQRILLKITGESLSSKKDGNIHYQSVSKVAEQIQSIHNLGVEIGLVIGGGNLFRASENGQNFNRCTADYVGMLGTVMNSLCIKDALTQLGIESQIVSSIGVDGLTQYFEYRHTIRLLESNKIVIFAAGTGNPYFTTDTAGVLRALEIQADIMLKATKVDGVYASDPMHYKTTSPYYSQLTHQDILDKNLHIVDSSAALLARDNHLPILIFNFFESKNLYRIITGEKLGTLISS